MEEDLDFLVVFYYLCFSVCLRELLFLCDMFLCFFVGVYLRGLFLEN